MAAKAQLAEAERLLRECLEAFSNVAPVHLYQKGCFNFNSVGLGPDCPCTACTVRRYLDA